MDNYNYNNVNKSIQNTRFPLIAAVIAGTIILTVVVGYIIIKHQRNDAMRQSEWGYQLPQEQIVYHEAIEQIKAQKWEEARQLMLSIPPGSSVYTSAQNKIKVLDQIMNCGYKKGEYELRIYDSQGNMTGLFNGETREEIPYSAYKSESSGESALVPADDNYTYEFFCRKAGNYQFILTAHIQGKTTKFILENIPISEGATHRVQVDTQAVAEGRKEALLLIDEDSDGYFEQEISFEEKLTCEDFLIKTKMPEVNFE